MVYRGLLALALARVPPRFGASRSRRLNLGPSPAPVRPWPLRGAVRTMRVEASRGLSREAAASESDGHMTQRRSSTEAHCVAGCAASVRP